MDKELSKRLETVAINGQWNGDQTETNRDHKQSFTEASARYCASQYADK